MSASRTDEAQTPVAVAARGVQCQTACPPAHGAVARTYLLLVAGLGAISGIVVIEPAPYDVALPILFALGVVTGCLRFQERALIALVAAGAFLVGNVVSMIGIRGPSLLDGARYLAITGYLVMSWTFFVGLFGRFDHGGVRAFFAGYAAGACTAVILVVGALFEVSPAPEGFVWAGRAVALFKDPNVFGPFLIPVALYAALKASTDRRWEYRVVWSVVFVLTSLGVLLSLSRAAWGSYVLGVALYALLAFPGSRALGRRVALPAIAALALFLPLWHVVGHEYGELLFSRVGLQPYDDDRFATQGQAAAMSLSAVGGIGPGQAEKVLDYATHSLYLRVLVENGWLGATAFAAFLFGILARTIQGVRGWHGRRPYFAFCTAAVVSVLFNGAFVDTLHWRHLWLVLALPWIGHESAAAHHAR